MFTNDSPRYQIVLKVLLLVGAFNYCYWALLVTTQSSSKILGGLVAIATLVLASQRDFYLPFLGQGVFPIVASRPPPNAQTFTITGVPPNVSVIYWAAKRNQSPFPDFKQAYGNFENSGLTMSDSNGTAIAALQCPAPYSVGKIFDKQLPKHLHYRYELPNSKGMFSRVFTQDLVC